MQTQPDTALSRRLFEAFLDVRRWKWGSPQKWSGTRLLLFLYRNCRDGEPGLRLSDIGAALRVTSPTVTQWVDALEGRGWVERQADPQDRRAVRVHLTPEGKERAEWVRAAISETFDALVEHLGEEDSDRLCELLFKVARFAERRAGAGPL